jgi:hypothetical protein
MIRIVYASNGRWNEVKETQEYRQVMSTSLVSGGNGRGAVLDEFGLTPGSMTS